MDPTEFRKRFWLKVLTRPLTFWPVVGGATVAIGSWAVGRPSGALLFSGVIGLLAGVGSFFHNVLLRTERFRDEVLGEMQAETDAAQARVLDELEGRLRADGDPRTERSLRDLRVLLANFSKEGPWATDMNAHSRFELLDGVERLFAGSVRHLRKSLELWETARGMESDVTRRPLLDQRERLIGEVTDGIAHLSRLFAELQSLGRTGREEGDLRRIREELDRNLDVARRVERQVAEWDAGPGRVGERDAGRGEGPSA